METKNNNNELTKLIKPVAQVSHKKRWIMLLIFCMTTLSNACNFTTASAINNIASKYYNVTPDVVNWLGNSFILIYLVVALPSAYIMTKIGLRATLVIAVSLNTAGSCFHFAGCPRDSFNYVIVGQIFAALAVGYILNVPPKLAAIWFNYKEQSKATSIGVFANILGAATGFLQSTQMVPDTEDLDLIGKGIYKLYLSQLIFMVVNLILVYIFFESKPPIKVTPIKDNSEQSSLDNSNEQEISFTTSLKILAKNKDFHFHVHGFGLYFGMFVVTDVILNQLLNRTLSASDIGWIGFAYQCCGIAGMILSGVIMDKCKHFKLLSFILVFGALLSWSTSTVLLVQKLPEYYLLVSFSIGGFFSLAYISHGVVQLAEMTHPIPESTSTAFLFILGNVYAFLFNIVLGWLVDHGRSELALYSGIGIYLLSLTLVCVTKVRLRKQENEKQEPYAVNG